MFGTRSRLAAIAVLVLSHAAQTSWLPHATAAVPSCAKGGSCQLGDVGPSGGIVFYVAGSPQWWGQYMEVPLVNSRTKQNPWLVQGAVHTGPDAKAKRIEGKAIGAGSTNHERIFGPGNKFFVPSKDELDALYNYIVTSGSRLRSVYRTGVNGDPYWTSSEASETFAWYQLFNDGTQFTDDNGIIRGLSGNKSQTKSNVHTGSSFPAKPMQVAMVSAFAARGVTLPPKPQRPEVPAGGRTTSDCTLGLSCKVGDIGPGGGIVFYDAGSKQPWGRWLEAAPAACETAAKVWRVAAAGRVGTQQLPLLYPIWKTAARQRVDSKRLGMGKTNTALIVRQHKGLSQTALDGTAAGYADSLICGGKDDWFLPSKDELDALYNVLAVADHDLTGSNAFGFGRGFYWTSSEYNNENAWTQYWVDGQQFDREKWLNANEQQRAGGQDPRPFRVRPIRAFG